MHKILSFFAAILLLSLLLCGHAVFAGDNTKPDQLINEGIDDIDESRDERYQHGCIQVCFYETKRCGWGKVQSDDTDLNDLCDWARERADYACYVNFKYPVTRCEKYNSW